MAGGEDLPAGAEPAARGCPACGAYLWHLRREGQLVEMCSACGGLWLDPGEVTALVRVYRPLDAASGRPSARACLRCAASLRALAWPGTAVEVDACPTCGGLWLDRGELEAIRAAVAPLVGGPQASLQARASELLADADAARSRRPACPACGGALAAASLRQDAAGVTSIDGGDAAAPPGAARSPSGRGGVERCAACGGAWLDPGLLTLALGVSRRLKLGDAQATSGRCVRCPDQALAGLSYPGTSVRLDVCPDCRGTWLPPGALTSLVSALRV